MEELNTKTGAVSEGKFGAVESRGVTRAGLG